MRGLPCPPSRAIQAAAIPPPVGRPSEGSEVTDSAGSGRARAAVLGGVDPSRPAKLNRPRRCRPDQGGPRSRVIVPIASTLAPVLPHERGHPQVHVEHERGDEQSPHGGSRHGDAVQPQLHRNDQDQRPQLSPLPALERAPRRRLGLRHNSQPSRGPAPGAAVIRLASAASRPIPTRSGAPA
jgi:hypothetical protein